MMRKTISFLLLLLAFATSASAKGRKDVLINDGWRVKALEYAQRNAKYEEVTLPHTWNARYEEGTHRYERTAKAYERNLTVTPEMLKGRLWLYFEGVNSTASVFINKRSVGEHKGGYTAFCLEITDAVKPGDNLLEVWASNAFRTDVLPLSGDFNVYGGIHRPVHLIMTGRECIRPDYYASPGVFVRQDNVSAERAGLTVTTMLSAAGKMSARGAGQWDGNAEFTLSTTVYDAKGQAVATSVLPVDADSMNQKIVIEKPHLWNGRKSPYLYKVVTSLKRNTETVDEVTVYTGLRFFSVDNKHGFILNGNRYALYGVNRHEDFQGTGSALGDKEYHKDVALLCELGATAVRLAHYPHGERFINMADSCGFVLWSEIPLCGPGGYLFTGYLDTAAANARQTMREMILQKFNHPSICFWGLFNELLKDNEIMREYDNPVPEVKTLNDLAHSLDRSRLTTFATCVDHNEYKGCSDLMAWNRYFSWKTAEKEAARFFDEAAATAYPTPMGVSEYGRGGATMQHADPKYPVENTVQGFHPEEYQTLCHEGYWAALRTRDNLWIKTVWQFSDTQSTIKDEGDFPGRNDKGLVTYDRQTRKDAFYFYKANWNAEPMLHLCSKRFTKRNHPVTDIRVYTTLPEVTLYVNGKRVATEKSDDMHRVVFCDVTLNDGENEIKVEAGSGKRRLSDTAIWTLDKADSGQ